jgi:hypothetical protein
MMGVVNEKGELTFDYPIFNANSGFDMDINEPLDLSKRRYVKEALAKEYWSYSGEEFYIERIYNIEDSRKNTMLAFPRQNGNQSIVIAGIYFGSWRN